MSWVIGVPLLIGVIGCGRSTGEAPTADDDAAASATGTDGANGPNGESGAAVTRPRLGEVRIVDLTPPEIRQASIPPQLDDLVTQALATDFDRAEGAADACRASIGIGYALIVNKQPVLEADAGDAHALFEGELFCPIPGGKGTEDIDEFRVKLDTERNFGGAGGGTGKERLLEVVRSVIADGAAGLYGQVRMRHASDDEIRRTLASSQHPGLLAEAASEAGERHLIAAVPDLARLCADDNGRIAARAGAALGQLKVATPEVVKALVHMTEGADTEKHLVAINALADLGTPEAKRYLESLAVGHPSAALREVARERLHGLGTELPPEKPDQPEPVPDNVP